MDFAVCEQLSEHTLQILPHLKDQSDAQSFLPEQSNNNPYAGTDHCVGRSKVLWRTFQNLLLWEKVKTYIYL